MSIICSEYGNNIWLSRNVWWLWYFEEKIRESIRVSKAEAIDNSFEMSSEFATDPPKKKDAASEMQAKKVNKIFRKKNLLNAEIAKIRSRRRKLRRRCFFRTYIMGFNGTLIKPENSLF